MAETLTSLLNVRAAACPGGIPTILPASGEDGQDVQITYAQILRRAHAIATYLLERLGPGRRVLLAYPTGLEFMASFFGSMYAGVIPVPVPPPLPGVLASRYNQVVADCQPDLVLTQSQWAGLFSRPGVVATDAIPGPSRGVDGLGLTDIGPADVAYLQYTSGTTGNPKGVLVTHRSALAAARMTESVVKLRSDELAGTWLPNWHDLGLGISVLLPVAANRTVVVTEPLSFAADPMRWLQDLARRRVRSAAMPWFAYDILVRRTTAAQRAGLDLSYWRQAGSGAEVADPAILQEFRDAFAPSGIGPDTLYGTYGMAETVMMAAAEVPGRGHAVVHADRDALAAGRVVPRPGGVAISGSGRPLPEVDLLIVQRDTLAPCPPGTVGEILVAGPNVCPGYWGRPDPHVTVAGRRYMPTGDLGTLLGGELFVLGRAADLITVAGRQHFPALIERTIAHAVPSVRASTCTAFQDGDSVIVAVEASGRNGHAAEAADAIRAVVAADHGVELADVVLAKHGGIPMTTSKKQCRVECRARYRSGLLHSEIADSRATGAFMVMAGASALCIQFYTEIQEQVLYGGYMSSDDRYTTPVSQEAWAVPSGAPAQFTWHYDDGRQRLLDLYQRGKDKQWDATKRIDWDSPVSPFNVVGIPDKLCAIYGSRQWNILSRKERDELKYNQSSWLFSQFLHGEQGALTVAARIVESVPDVDAKFYAATQAMDEARHMEVFSRFIREKIGVYYPINPDLAKLLSNALSDPNWDMPYLGMQVLIEGLALAAFGVHRDVATTPLVKQVLTYVMSDEARHVAFGRLSLRDYYAQLTTAERTYREEFVVEGCYLLRNRFRQEEVWERMGFNVAECLEYAEHSPIQRYFRNVLFHRIVPCVKDIGLWGPTVQKAYADLGILDAASADLMAMLHDDEDRAERLEREQAAELAIRKAEVDAYIAVGAGAQVIQFPRRAA